GADAAPVQRRRLDRLNSVFLDHDLTIAAFWANLVATLRPTPVALRRWLPERDLRARRLRVRDPRDGRWLPFLPDAAFELRYPSGSTTRGRGTTSPTTPPASSTTEPTRRIRGPHARRASWRRDAPRTWGWMPRPVRFGMPMFWEGTPVAGSRLIALRVPRLPI